MLCARQYRFLNGMVSCRAVRIWVRTHRGATSPSVDVQAVHRLTATSNSRKKRNTANKEKAKPHNQSVDYLGSTCKGLGLNRQHVEIQGNLQILNLNPLAYLAYWTGSAVSDLITQRALLIAPLFPDIECGVVKLPREVRAKIPSFLNDQSLRLVTCVFNETGSPKYALYMPVDRNVDCVPLCEVNAKGCAK